MEEYERERDSDPAFRAAKREYFGNDAPRRRSQRKQIRLGEPYSGCSWIRIERPE